MSYPCPHVNTSTCNASACNTSARSNWFFLSFSFMLIRICVPTRPQELHPHAHVHHQICIWPRLYLVSFLFLSFLFFSVSRSFFLESSAPARQCVHMLTRVFTLTTCWVSFFLFLFPYSHPPLHAPASAGQHVCTRPSTRFRSPPPG